MRGIAQHHKTLALFFEVIDLCSGSYRVGMLSLKFNTVAIVGFYFPNCQRINIISVYFLCFSAGYVRALCLTNPYVKHP